MSSNRQRPGRAAEAAIDATSGNTGLLFNIALSYGGRTEIVDACRKAIVESQAGSLESA